MSNDFLISNSVIECVEMVILSCVEVLYVFFFCTDAKQKTKHR